MTRLDDLRALTGQAVSGAITATAALDGGIATVDLDAIRAGIPGSAVGRAVLKARVTNPTAHPCVAATLDAEGIEAGGIGGSAKVAVTGPEDALAVKLNAALTNLAGAPATVATAATVNVPGKTVQLAALTADWKGQADPAAGAGARQLRRWGRGGPAADRPAERGAGGRGTRDAGAEPDG